MASTWLCDPKLIEVMTVDDDKCVTIDALGLERTIDMSAHPDHEVVRDMLAAVVPECAYMLLPPRFNASIRLRMSIERLAEGDLDDYATDESVRHSVRRADTDATAVGRVAGNIPMLSVLLITGAVPFVWSQATRTDLPADILSVSAHDLLATEGIRRAIGTYARRAQGNRQPRLPR